ncbi:MAG: HAD family hydrolase, partial [Proteobacteria bacterium]|nr:HAD family hydrolase [Pseudomonadota bacterium]
QPNDWRDVVKQILGPAPKARPIWYQKHMTQHMLPAFGRGWIGEMRNAFLIRAPEDVLASYTQKRGEVSLMDIGFVQQREMFEQEADRLGHAPPVVESSDVPRNPRGTLGALCKALDIPFSEKMLAWPAGRRDSDGVWAPAWYDAVEKSTGFAVPRDKPAPVLSDDLKRIADDARPHYERLAKYKLSA